MIENLSFLGGFLMGLAGSLHCAGLCGGIASSLLITSPGTMTSRAKLLMATQFGRVMTYALMGGLVGGVSAGFSGLLDLAGLQWVLRLLAAGILLWSGLAIMEVVPGFPLLDRLMLRTAAIGSRPVPFAIRRASPVLCGMLWGLAPCGMVYGALMNAMFSGSAVAGMLFMAGFGCATVPVVGLSAFGAGTLAACGQRGHMARKLKRGIGATVMTLGLASMIEPGARLAELCM